ncbi:MAG: UbiD family decarboxylase domain-containing protein, partial [Thermoplasmata archaeon]
MYYDILNQLDNVIKINEHVSKNIEVTKYLLKYPKNPVYFKDLDGYEATGNIWAERKNISKVLNNADILQTLLYAINNPENYEVLDYNPFNQTNDFSLKSLPIPKYFEKDGSNYITSGIVFSEKDGKKNVSFHRMMVIDEKRVA